MSNDCTFTIFHRPNAPQAFDAAMAIRTQVFVDEQHVPPEEELDHWDDTAVHFLVALSESPDTPVATGRFIPYDDGRTAKIGRVAVLKSKRGLGLGKILMQEMMAEAKRQGFQGALLDAQTHALGFYQQLGFVAEGEEFMDAGIPHFRMRCPL